MNPQMKLLTSRRFMPLFLAQVTGAFADNLFKSAFIMLVTFGALRNENAGLISAIAAACLVLPYVIASGIAGEIADRFDRGRLLRIVKLIELISFVLAAAVLWSGSITLGLAVLVLVGTQAAFGSPVKYALLPQHLADSELINGNALLEAGTFLSILFGTLSGGIASAAEWGVSVAGIAMILAGIAGLVVSFWVPPSPAPMPQMVLHRNPITATRVILADAWADRPLRLSLLGISWFWLIGSVFLSEFPALVSRQLGGGEGIVTLFLALFSLGVGLGSLLCGRLMQGEISARWVPVASLGMTVAALDLSWSTSSAHPGTGILGVAAFLEQASGWHITLDLLAVALAGGCFVVPLYAIAQHQAGEARRARAAAVNNFLNALFMVAGSVVAALVLGLGASIPQLFLLCGLGSVVTTWFVCRLLPASLLRAAFQLWFKLLYRVEIIGLNNIPPATERTLIVSNHVSYIDGALLAAFLPQEPVFAVYGLLDRKWYFRLFLSAARTVKLDPTKPLGTRLLINALRDGGHPVVIFPEGRLNSTGGTLMKIYHGPGMIADKADAQILPVRLDGPEYTHFSRLGPRLGLRFFPKITITILPPQRIHLPDGVPMRVRRRLAGRQLYDIMSDMMGRRPNPSSVFEALLDASDAYGAKRPILEDPNRMPLDYDRVIMGALALGRRFQRLAKRGAAIGVLLPNANGSVLAYMGLQAFGRVPAMLNYTAGPAAVRSALRTAEIRVVITSRLFVERARLDWVAEGLGPEIRIVWLEDLRQRMGWGDKLYALVARRFARILHRRRGIGAEETATILFTSGSEGAPKAVALSHANILANRRQIAARIDFSPADIVLNALPMFHAFGLTAATLLPILSGVRLFVYPSPLHYRIVPEMAYDIGATILFGTDTFLMGYARMADPYDFYSVRYVVAGAERVRDETRAAWMDRFGKRILEGYGVTECAPVVAVNTPMYFKAGTVGRVLPEIETRLIPVPGIAEGGRLELRGPNVMKGYIRAAAPGVIEPPAEGWYDTGDIVSIDEDGFITILGRLKRFAKIAGEMVSLAGVEAASLQAWPETATAAVAISDARKGEKIILVVAGAVDPAPFLAGLRATGLADLAMPKAVITVEALPLLGSGKINYPAVKAIAEAGAA